MKNPNDSIGNRARDLPDCSLNQLRHRVAPIQALVIRNLYSMCDVTESNSETRKSSSMSFTYLLAYGL